MRGQFMVLMQAIDDASDVDDEIIGGWLRVARFCAGKLNGGRIPGCQSWSKDDWLRAARVSRKRVESIVAGGLASWDGADLVLHHYDVKGDDIYRRQQAGGQVTAAKRREVTTPGDQGRSPPRETTPGDQGRHSSAVQGGGKDIIPSTDVSEADPPRDRTANRLIFSKGQAATWRDKNADLYRSLAASFNEPGAKVVDVLRFFQVKWETRQDGPLNGEWTENTQRHSPAEVFEIFAAAPIASIKLPSHFRAARDTFEMTERTV